MHVHLTEPQRGGRVALLRRLGHPLGRPRLAHRNTRASSVQDAHHGLRGHATGVRVAHNFRELRLVY